MGKKSRQKSGPDKVWNKSGNFRSRWGAFLLTLLVALIAATIWGNFRRPATSIEFNPEAEIDSTLAAVAVTNSKRQLDELTTQLFALLPKLDAARSIPVWKVLVAVADRREELARDAEQKASATRDQLVACQALVNAARGRYSDLVPALYLLEDLAKKNTEGADDRVAKQALNSRLLASAVGYSQIKQDAMAIEQFCETIKQASKRFPLDTEMMRLLEGCLEEFGRLGASEISDRVVTTIREQYGLSSDPKVTAWVKLISEKQKLASLKIVEQLVKASRGDELAFSEVSKAASELIRAKPSEFSLQSSLDLAQFLENLGKIEPARIAYQGIVSLVDVDCSVEDLTRIQKAAQTSLDRLGLIGQKMELPGQGNAAILSEITVVQFVSSRNSLLPLRDAIAELAPFADRGCRLLIGSPDMTNEELVAGFGSLAKSVGLLQQSESEKLGLKWHLTSSPFVYVFDRGVLVQTGTPLDRLKPWLEARLLVK
jgi:hypothetical protein